MKVKYKRDAIFCSPIEMEEMFKRLTQTFFTSGFRGEIQKPYPKAAPCCEYKIIVKMPSYAEHKMAALIEISNSDINWDIPDDDFKDKKVLASKRYLNLLEAVTQRLFYTVGAWIVNEQTTMDNRSFLNYYNISKWHEDLLHNDEAQMMKICQAMKAACEESSFLKHYSKKYDPMGVFSPIDVNDAKFAYKAFLQKCGFKGKAIKLGRIGTSQEPNFMVMSFRSQKTELKINIYTNEVRPIQINSGQDGVTCYFNVIKMLVYEKLMKLVQEGKVSDEAQSDFVRKLLVLQEEESD